MDLKGICLRRTKFAAFEWLHRLASIQLQSHQLIQLEVEIEFIRQNRLDCQSFESASVEQLEGSISEYCGYLFLLEHPWHLEVFTCCNLPRF